MINTKTLIALGAAAGVVVYFGATLGVALWRAHALTSASTAFDMARQSATARVLVVGDSTAVGTGAGDPALSIAGRLASAFEQIEIENRAADGALTADVLSQVRNARHERYDVVLIQSGGNDVLRFTSLDRLRRDTGELLDAAGRRAPYVAMMSTGDVGSAPAFPWPLDTFLSRRTRQVRSVLLELVALKRVDYVDLFDDGPENPFRREPHIHYARDGLHPSAQGYHVWFERLLAATSIASVLSAARQAAD